MNKECICNEKTKQRSCNNNSTAGNHLLDSGWIRVIPDLREARKHLSAEAHGRRSRQREGKGKGEAEGTPAAEGERTEAVEPYPR